MVIYHCYMKNYESSWCQIYHLLWHWSFMTNYRATSNGKVGIMTSISFRYSTEFMLKVMLRFCSILPLLFSNDSLVQDNYLTAQGQLGKPVGHQEISHLYPLRCDNITNRKQTGTKPLANHMRGTLPTDMVITRPKLNTKKPSANLDP